MASQSPARSAQTPALSVALMVAVVVVGALVWTSAPLLASSSPGCFTPASGSPINVGINPRSVAVGDFNGDGRLDLAVANQGSNSVSVLLGQGDGTFTPASGSPITVGNGPASVAVGDFNGDGRLDLAAVNESFSSNSVSVLLGQGDGTFTPASGSPITVGNNPAAVAVGDFTGDGKLDLAVANAGSNSVSVLLGQGDGTFTPASGSPITVGINPNAVAVGDFTGDGKLDLAVANSTGNTVTILRGNGDGTFTPASGSPITVGNNPRSVGVRDFNGDGRLDLAVANQDSNNVSVLLGQGDGTFAPASGSPITVGNNPASVAVGDFTGDGKLDLAVANFNSNSVSLLLGQGDGTFTPASGSPITVGRGPASVTVGDFTGDGKLDLAVANFLGGTVTILLNGQCPDATATVISGTATAFALTSTAIAGTATAAAQTATPNAATATAAAQTATAVSGTATAISGTATAFALTQTAADATATTAAQTATAAALTSTPNAATATAAAQTATAVSGTATAVSGTATAFALTSTPPPTATPTSTFTPTVTGTATSTPPPTATPTATGTATGTLTPTPTGTRTPPPTATPTATATAPAPATPTPLPNPVVTSVANGDGRLRVTVSFPVATASCTAAPLLSFEAASVNGVIDIGTAVGQTPPFQQAVSPGTQAVVFFVRRVEAGQPTTIRLTVVDACGRAWPTFVGGGPSAF